VKGKLAGCVWDFFVSPQESARTAYDLLSLAIQEGGSRLATPDHPVSTQFFELFGFQAVVMARGNAGNNVHMFLMADVYQKLKPRIFEFLQHMDTRNEVVASDAPKDACASCGLGPQALVAGNGVGGYKCSRCGFIRIYGPNLTIGPPKPQPPKPSWWRQFLSR
jgi:hypothetical protein